MSALVQPWPDGDQYFSFAVAERLQPVIDGTPERRR
jgi:hypothetical protein